MGARDEDAKERLWKLTEEKRKVKRVNEQFGRNRNQNVNGNRKLFWKEVRNTNGGKVESCSRIKDGTEEL